MKDNFEKLAKEWLITADEDFNVAKLLYSERNYPKACCFHCHQAAEKYLKGFLVYNGKDIEEEFKIHNLNKLFDYCREANKDFDKDGGLEKACNFLNKYYIATRYPGDMEEYTWEEVKEALESVEIIKDKMSYATSL